MKTQLQLIQEAYSNMVSEEIHPAEVAQLKQDVVRTGKSHQELADEHTKYANHMESIGQRSLAVRSRALAAQHRELASIK